MGGIVTGNHGIRDVQSRTAWTLMQSHAPLMPDATSF